jgi:hypothetical protein
MSLSGELALEEDIEMTYGYGINEQTNGSIEGWLD